MQQLTPSPNNSLTHAAAGNLAFLLSVIRCGESLSKDEEANVRKIIQHLESPNSPTPSESEEARAVAVKIAVRIGEAATGDRLPIAVSNLLRGWHAETELAVFEQLAPIITDALHAHSAALTERWKARNILLLEISGRGDMLKKEHVNPDALDGLVAVQNELDRLRNIVIRDLQTEVAALTRERTEMLGALERAQQARNQVTRERDTLREALASLAYSFDERDKGNPCWCYAESLNPDLGQQDRHLPKCQFARAALATPEENQ